MNSAPHFHLLCFCLFSDPLILELLLPCPAFHFSPPFLFELGVAIVRLPNYWGVTIVCWKIQLCVLVSIRGPSECGTTECSVVSNLLQAPSLSLPSSIILFCWRLQDYVRVVVCGIIFLFT